PLAVDVQADQLLLPGGLVGGLRHDAASSALATVSGVMGVLSSSVPVPRSASLTAFSTAAGAPMVPPSPAPLAPVSVNAQGVSRWSMPTSGISWAVGTL